ncbi:MAG: ergothioneine biosynthesis protein EgtB [Actinomycetota bacterium]
MGEIVDLRARLAGELESARRRSLDLLAPVPEPDLVRQISPIMSPLVWDLAHVGNYEDLWLVRAAGDAPAVDPSVDSMYDAFRHPRPNRPSLPLLGPREARRYIAEVRARVLDTLGTADLEGGDRLLRRGFVYAMVAQHEHQHDETMLATMALMGEAAHRPVAPLPPRGAPVARPEVFVEGGPFVMGTSADPWAYDNEGPAHEVDLAPFWIDTVPVTNRDYAEFIADGGYRDRRWWGDEGWAWLQDEGAQHPLFWRPEGHGDWSRVRFGWVEEVPGDEPVQHVCWHEADAYARWAGKRLPTEAEWEKAASWGPGTAGAGPVKRYWPWGDEPPAPERANLGQSCFRPAPVGSHPAGASAYGAHQMIGDVWEWTSSDFEPYPGFSAFPYREYSEVFFGSGYKVLRGGSWATAPVAVRSTFRNWDLAVRRQIFSGLRCARDA